MARIRSVHPGLFTDEAFVSCSPLARLLFIAVWTEADDFGAFEWKPLQLKMRALPVDNVDTAKLLGELADANMIRRYTMGGRELGIVRNFGRFQRPKKPKGVHPIPVELRIFGACDARNPEMHEAEEPTVPKKAELIDPETGEVLRSSRIPPQMEDGGWRMEEDPSVGKDLTLGRLVPQSPA